MANLDVTTQDMGRAVNGHDKHDLIFKPVTIKDPEDIVAASIVMMGDDPDREGLKDTPRRVIRSYRELFAGYKMDPKKILSTTFDKEGYDQIVMLKDIEFYSACEHHLVTFVGKVHVGYIPGKKVVGLSKLARLVECFSRRLQIQERMTQQIADAIDDNLSPKGVMVVVEAKHFCMCSRGVAKQHSSMVTSSIKGAFVKQAARQEFMDLIK